MGVGGGGDEGRVGREGREGTKAPSVQLEPWRTTSGSTLLRRPEEDAEPEDPSLSKEFCRLTPERL